MNYPKIKVTFLGTGTSSGVPMIGCNCPICTSTDTHDKRLRSSVLIQSATTTIVIDTTPDFRTQMLQENIQHLDAVIYTHSHKDHTAGMDDVRAYCYFQRKPMDIYATEYTQQSLKREFYYAFEDHKYPGVPNIILHTISKNAPFTIGDLKIIPILVLHHHMPVLAYRIGDFTYITDANYIEEHERDKIRGSKIMVVNALRKEKHISHFTLSEAIDLIQDLEVPQGYLTHVSHQMGKYADVSNELPTGIHFAYDGLKLEL